MAKKYIQDFKSKLSNGVTMAPEELQDFFSRLEGDLKDKKYGLVWESQAEQVIEQLKTNKVYLEEEQDLKITQEPDNPNSNILIEGDNYEALTYLKEINQKVDVIYIDPPYNTGNKDFIYNDRFIDKEDGFRHSQWLSFMDARLRLARELLTDDGVIFISIDDNEQAQLKLLCDEVFGERNFVDRLTWLKGATGKNDVKGFKSATEVVLVYMKKVEYLNVKGVEDTNKGKYKLRDEHYDERGGYYLITLDQASLGYVETLDFGIQVEGVGFEIFPNGRKGKREGNEDEHRWRWGKEKVLWGLENDFIVYKKSKGKHRLYTKQYEKVDNNLEPVGRTMIPENILQGFSTRQGKDMLVEIMGKSTYFSYPKPVKLIKYLIDRVDKPNAVILDFFAGSGTTGHAVLELNQQDGGNRQFILVTNNENNIARDVTYERNKRVIEGYTTPKGKDVSGIPSNLAYYRTKQVSKYEIDFDEVVLQHIIPTIQLTERVYSRTQHSQHITQLGENIFIFNQYMVEDDEIDTLVGLVKDEDILYIQEGQVDYIKSKLPEGVVYKYLEDILPNNH